MTLKSRPLLLSAVLASPLLFAFDLRGDAPSFDPEAGTRVDKELSLTGAMYIDDLMFIVDGEEMPAEMLGDVLDSAFEFEMTEGVTDEFVKSGGGRPLVLLRTYNEFSMDMSFGGESQEMDEEMDLLDSTIKFTWNAEEETYDITYEEGSGDDEDLDGLDVDMDFTFLLPTDDVKEGSSWEVTGVEAGRLFIPGGTTGGSGDFPEEASELGEVAEELLGPQLEDALEDFVVDCTYKGDEDGAMLIAIEFEGELNLDFSELMMAALEMEGIGDLEFDADITLTMDIEMEGEGVLTWDNEAGHAQAFEMAIDIVITVDGEADIEVGGESHSAEATLEFSGELEYEMSVD